MSFQPQTPQSPSQFSPATTDPVSTVNSSMSSFTAALPTPAHSVNGSNLPSDPNQDVIMGGDSPQKRKREQADHGGQEREKRVQIDDGIPNIEAIHEDVGEKYLLLKKKWEPARPLCSDDLFETYGLTGIAGDVARVLPDGSKNAMRKTYKGHIKKLGLTGHFDAVKKEPNDPEGLLMGVALVPQEDWHSLMVKGKELSAGFRPEVQRALPKATSMARGPIAKEKWDASVLADFAGSVKGSSSAKATAPGTPLNPAISAVPRIKTQGPGPQEVVRARRVKKRNYNDSSFEGYETGGDTGYSTGEGEAGTKRRKKVLRASTDPVSVWIPMLTHRRMLSPALAHRTRPTMLVLACWVPERPTSRRRQLRSRRLASYHKPLAPKGPVSFPERFSARLGPWTEHSVAFITEVTESLRASRYASKLVSPQHWTIVTAWAGSPHETAVHSSNMQLDQQTPVDSSLMGDSRERGREMMGYQRVLLPHKHRHRR